MAAINKAIEETEAKLKIAKTSLLLNDNEQNRKHVNSLESCLTIYKYLKHDTFKLTYNKITMHTKSYEAYLNAKTVDLIVGDGPVPPMYQIDVSELTREEAVSMGFGNWDEELLLIPARILHLLKPGITVICINGDLHLTGELDDDTRGGMLAYGIKPTK